MEKVLYFLGVLALGLILVFVLYLVAQIVLPLILLVVLIQLINDTQREHKDDKRTRDD